MIRTKLLIAIAFLSTIISTNAQEITGIYQVDDIALTVADIGMTYKFEKDGTFRKIIYEHLRRETISGGNYMLMGNTLTLKYGKISLPLPNPINIVNKVGLKSSSASSFTPLFAEIRVFDSKGNPQPGANLILLNKNEKPVMAFSSDSSGNFPSLSLFDKYITDIQVSFIGYKEASIKTDSLFNHRIGIEIKLNDSSQEYENTEMTINYTIKKLTQKRIELVSNKTNDKHKMILIKKK